MPIEITDAAAEVMPAVRSCRSVSDASARVECNVVPDNLHHGGDPRLAQRAHGAAAQVQIAQQAAGIRVGADQARDIRIGAENIRQAGKQQEGAHKGQKSARQVEHRLDKAPVEAKQRTQRNDADDDDVNRVQETSLLLPLI